MVQPLRRLSLLARLAEEVEVAEVAELGAAVARDVLGPREVEDLATERDRVDLAVSVLHADPLRGIDGRIHVRGALLVQDREALALSDEDRQDAAARLGVGGARVVTRELLVGGPEDQRRDDVSVRVARGRGGDLHQPTVHHRERVGEHEAREGVAHQARLGELRRGEGGQALGADRAPLPVHEERQLGGRGRGERVGDPLADRGALARGERGGHVEGREREGGVGGHRLAEPGAHRVEALLVTTEVLAPAGLLVRAVDAPHANAGLGHADQQDGDHDLRAQTEAGAAGATFAHRLELSFESEASRRRR